ncbi:MAG: hypothetical protein IJA51_03605 [Oscillospiraceae bacterium]|nr:hypothetical protein [Oscillospiraceae bacterium]
MKRLLILLLCLTLLSGCGATTVVLPAPDDSPAEETPSTQPDPHSTPVKLGLAVLAHVSDSMNATADSHGYARTDVTLVALTIDDTGVIRSCRIDGISAAIPFDASGALQIDADTTFPTKNELGLDYGMHKASPMGKEWDQQASAFAAYAVGKRVAELSPGDVSSSVTISTDDFLRAIRTAADSAEYLGSNSDDALTLVALSHMDGSESAEVDTGESGQAQFSTSVAAVTFQGDTITGCCLDELQTALTIAPDGTITDDVTAAQRSKNALGEDYGMRKASSIGREWYQQADAFARYAVGKTARNLSALITDEDGYLLSGDVTSSVTIAVDTFQALLVKAAGRIGV